MSSITAIVLDIEGTTTSISFVYDVLFPFARAHMDSYLKAHWDDESVQRDVESLVAQSAIDAKAGEGNALPLEPTPDETLTYLHALMDADRKVTGLKSLQGKIWRSGYDSGELKGHVFDDVPEALKRWSEAGIPVCIYSSGSVAAQKLLFGCSEAGDLTQYLSGYYDTLIGPKTDPDSYTKIVESLAVDAENVLFATDKHSEAVAADQAGLSVLITLRPGNAPLPPEHGFRTAEDFTNIP